MPGKCNGRATGLAARDCAGPPARSAGYSYKQPCCYVERPRPVLPGPILAQALHRADTHPSPEGADDRARASPAFMHIAYLAPLIESVPPTLYGGTERVVSWLSEEMLRRGHEVTLFASGDSTTGGRLVPASPRALRFSGVQDALPYTLMMIEDAFRRGREFDLFHCHVDWLAFPFMRFVDVPAVHTLHGRLDLPFYREIFAHHPEVSLVSISDAQREPLPGTRFLETVHHGMPRDLYCTSDEQEDYLVFLGRISVEKGPVQAIQAARRAGARLVIAAKIDPADQAYFDSQVRDLLDEPGIDFIGEVADEQKNLLLARARALLAPIDWPEPFGLVFIEALACGTPIITRPCGSAREIVEHGRTGLIGSSTEELARAIEEIGSIDRAACRAAFEERFSVERMAADYEAVYRRVLGRGARRSARAGAAD